jgi:hypothetical protein
VNWFNAAPGELSNDPEWEPLPVDAWEPYTDLCPCCGGNGGVIDNDVWSTCQRCHGLCYVQKGSAR